MAALFDLFDPEIRSVIERRLSTWINQGQLVCQGIAVGELRQQIGALVESDQEKIVVAVAGLDECPQGFTCTVKLALHTAGYIENDSQANRYIIVAEMRDLLFDLILEDFEVVLIQASYQPVIRIGDRNRQRDKVGVIYDAVLVVTKRIRWTRGRLLCW